MTYPANIYLLKGSNRNTRKMCEICSKSTTKTPEWHHWRWSSVFIFNLEHISHPFLVSSVFIGNFEQVNISWGRLVTDRKRERWHYVASPANIYLFKVNNRHTRKRSEISSKLLLLKVTEICSKLPLIITTTQLHSAKAWAPVLHRF